jgi:hypothetical protein
MQTSLLLASSCPRLIRTGRSANPAIVSHARWAHRNMIRKAHRTQPNTGRALRSASRSLQIAQCSAATEDYIDAESEVIDNRIPVTVSHYGF